MGYITATLGYTLLNGNYKNYNVFRQLDEITACIQSIIPYSSGYRPPPRIGCEIKKSRGGPIFHGFLGNFRGTQLVISKKKCEGGL
jgi:hypothetical protein